MIFTLKDIKGAVIKKKNKDEHTDRFDEFDAGYNCAIDAQCSVRLRLNREKLAKVITGWFNPGRNLEGGIVAHEIADAICAAAKDIVELDNGS